MGVRAEITRFDLKHKAISFKLYSGELQGFKIVITNESEHSIIYNGMWIRPGKSLAVGELKPIHEGQTVTIYADIKFTAKGVYVIKLGLYGYLNGKWVLLDTKVEKINTSASIPIFKIVSASINGISCCKNNRISAKVVKYKVVVKNEGTSGECVLTIYDRLRPQTLVKVNKTIKSGETATFTGTIEINNIMYISINVAPPGKPYTDRKDCGYVIPTKAKGEATATTIVPLIGLLPIIAIPLLERWSS